MKPRTITVTLFQGDDIAQAVELEAAVDAAAPIPGVPRKVGAVDERLAEALTAYDQFVTEADSRAVKITLQALPRKAWRDLVTAHPARDGDEQDEAYGFNTDAMADPLVMASITNISDAGEPVDADSHEAEVDSLSDGDFSKLFSAAVRLNLDASPAPKADLSSAVTRLFGETSRSLEGSDSPQASSTTSPT